MRPAQREPIYVFVTRFRQTMIIALLLASTALPLIAAAQSEGSSDPGNSDQAAPPAVDDSAPAAVPDDQPQANPAPLVAFPTIVPTATPIPLPFVRASLDSTGPGVLGPNHPSPTPNPRGGGVVSVPVLTHLLPDPTIQLPAVSQYDNSSEAINQIPSPVGAPLFVYIY